MDSVEKEKILTALRFLEMLVVSLDRIGSYAATQGVDHPEITNNFIDDYNVFKKAAEARQLLSEFFDDDIIEGQDMSELEVLLQDVKYWTSNDVADRP